jgi:hypothetical protein
MKFRKLAISISAAALGGVGVVLMTRGSRRFFSAMPHSGESLATGEDWGHAWNDSMRQELDQIRRAVEELKGNVQDESVNHSR